jgi:hypothetical protein
VSMTLFGKSVVGDVIKWRILRGVLRKAEGYLRHGGEREPPMVTIIAKLNRKVWFRKLQTPCPRAQCKCWSWASQVWYLCKSLVWSWIYRVLWTLGNSVFPLNPFLLRQSEFGFCCLEPKKSSRYRCSLMWSSAALWKR